MNTPRLDPAQLAGRILLVPGLTAPGSPNIVSTRRELVPRLSAGRPVAQLPQLLGSLYTLCGHAHRWTVARAIAAARGNPGGRTDAPAGADPAEVERHRLATLREQILRISHDWPLLLPGAPALGDAALLLRACPLWRDDLEPAERIALLPAWLEQKWLGRPPADWLARHADQPADRRGTWAADWAARCDSPVARLLRGQHAALLELATPEQSLGVHARPAETLPPLAARMPQPGFSLRPQLDDRDPDDHGAAQPARPVPDTGPWNRLRDPAPLPATSAWTRLLARLVEVLRLADTEGAGWLDHGALALGPHDGLAWTEMARGLLIYRVTLSAGDPARVAACQVLAPTEWNFHPDGTLAQALRQINTGDRAGADAAARRLAVAYDPCVEFVIARSPDDA